ncbi:solute carrier family 22 member 5-like isoform X1 [Astatotilapia calliptera]|uniref:Major facilitator superfamily (MFS) profile domain-containing protein n=1 Tax=Astatotilapia calliptera TaxID=8154 RepID=A0A3P8PQB8_ASTCA|nr:solute carrier family 22 member 5-like isoform X1 [Astatotilapia calliptera]
MRDYAETIGFLGQWGRFQQIVFFSLVATIMPNGFGAFTLVFLTDTPSHHCLVSGINLTEDWRKSVIPIKEVDGKQELSRCSRYRLDVVRNLSAQGYIPGRDVNLTDLEEEGCVDGWSYSKDIYESTIVSEFDLVCSNQWKQPFTSTVFFVGGLLGSFLSGQLSDRYGRKPVLFAALALQTVFTFAQVFSGSWIMFLIILFINGLGQMSNFVAALVLGSEVLTGKVRVLYSSLGTCLGFAIGYMILPLLAYFLRDWKSLSLALSLPCVAYVPFWWLMPESPRWLLSRGRVEEAEAIIRTAAKWNKVQAPRIIFEDCGTEKMQTHSKEHYNVFDLLRQSSMRATTLILCFVLFTMIVGYYSLSFNTAQLHENPYISCFISAVVEIPAYISSWMALLYLPRRLSVILTLVFGAVPLYLIQLVPDDLSNLALALEMLGKYSITTGSSLMFAYTAELYPTVLRNTATGISNTVSRIGSCIAPLLLSLGMYYKYLPYIILGSLAVVAAFAALFLPESFKKPLPETIEQMQRRERVKCPCLTRNMTPVPVVPMDSSL